MSVELNNESQFVFSGQFNGGFTSVPNAIFDDEKLTYNAIGLYCNILKFQNMPNWKIYQSYFINNKNGESKVRSAMKELEEAGYLEKKILRGERGKIAGVKYTVYLYPQPKKNPGSVENTNVSPKRDFPGTVKSKNGKTKNGEPVDNSIDSPLLENQETVESGMDTTFPPKRDFPVLDNPVLENQVLLNKDNNNKELNNKYNNSFINSNIVNSSIENREKEKNNTNDLFKSILGKSRNTEIDEAAATITKEKIIHKPMANSLDLENPIDRYKLWLQEMILRNGFGMKVDSRVGESLIILFNNKGITLDELTAIENFMASKQFPSEVTYMDYFKKCVNSGFKPHKNSKAQKKLSFDNFEQRNYDYDSLEKQLLGWE